MLTTPLKPLPVSCLALLLTASHGVAADTQLSQQQLGKLLFADVRLSTNNRYSCASCHQPDKYFIDAQSVAIGALGDKLQRNTPTLLNVSLQASFGWTDDDVTDLATQHRQPLLNTNPIELGFNPTQSALLDQDKQLDQLRQQAFPASTTFNTTLVTEALAAYIATLRYSSGFDRYLLEDDADGLSEQAKRGLALFTSERTQCVACHNGPLLGGGYRAQGKALLPARYEHRQVSEGALNIRVPSLRAVGFTAPYMIDGRLPDLPSVLAFYQSGEVSELPNFSLTPQESKDLLAFLRQL